MKRLLMQLIRFGMVGVFCTLLDYGLMILMVEWVHLPELTASALSFSLSTIVNYLLSVVFVFKVQQKTQGKKAFVIFVVLSLIGLAINQWIMAIAIQRFSIDYRLSKIVATVIVMLYNFITRKILLEKKTN